MNPQLKELLGVSAGFLALVGAYKGYKKYSKIKSSVILQHCKDEVIDLKELSSMESYALYKGCLRDIQAEGGYLGYSQRGPFKLAEKSNYT